MYHPDDPLGLSKTVERKAAKIRKEWNEKTRRYRLEGRRVVPPCEFPRYRIVYDPKDPDVMIGLEPV